MSLLSDPNTKCTLEGVQLGTLQTTAPDHCAFVAEQKPWEDNFHANPKGTRVGGNAMMVFNGKGVNQCRSPMNEFCRLTPKAPEPKSSILPE